MSKRILALILALVLTIGGTVSCGAETVSATASLSGSRGMLVRTGAGGDFPSAMDLSAKALKQELSDMVDYTAEAGYDTIYFEIRPGGAALYKSKVFPTSEYIAGEQGGFTFFDPLSQLIKLAKKKSIAVCAVIDPYTSGESEDTVSLNVSDVKALLSRYKKLSGVAVLGLDGISESAAENMLSSLSEVCGDTPLGAFVGSNSALTESNAIDFAVVSIGAKTGFDKKNFADVLTSIKSNAKCTVFTMVDTTAEDITAAEACAEIVLAQDMGVGAVVGNYRTLKNDDNFAGSLIASLQNTSFTVVTTADYSPAQTLTITRPTSKITTSDPAYFIMGTSNPDEPLMFGGEELDRQTADGVFGVLVNLESGTNTFTFNQGDKTETVTIVRPDGSESSSSGGYATTNKVTSMFPQSNTIAANGEEIAISCVAPANTRVTATLGGVTMELTQAAVASDGVPATFRGTITADGAAAGEVLDAGTITYRIVTYGTEFESAGHVYLTGEGAVPRVRVNTTSASVFYDSEAKAGYFKAIYKEGVIDTVISSTDELYEISSGFIKKSDVDVLTGKTEAAELTAVEAEHDDKAERFILRGTTGLPYTFVDNEDGSIDLTLYGVTLPEKIDTESTLFFSITWTQNSDDTIGVHFVPASEHGVWALDVFPDEGGTIIYARCTPTLSDVVGKPLSGITVVLDPGHGGNDSGALDTLGGYESDLNLANATALKYRLEQLGATVLLTRSTADEYESLYYRVGVGQETLPDFFISLHHNSIVTYADGYQHSGVEAYYYENFGKTLAENVVAEISSADYDRDCRGAFSGYYIVAKNRFAPSILCEIGFVPNPVENRYVHDETEIYKTANAFCTAILKTIAAWN